MHGLSNTVAAGFSCAQYEQWKAENTDGDDKFAALFEEGLVKPCPKCKKPIMKNEGEHSFLYSPCRVCWSFRVLFRAIVHVHYIVSESSVGHVRCLVSIHRGRVLCN